MNCPPAAQGRWLALPVWAVPVRVVLDTSDELDALEEALLGLLRITPRDVGELRSKLCLSPALVLSALASLVDRGIVSAPEQPGGLYTCTVDIRTTLADAARPGWAFYASGIGRFVSTIFLGNRPPSADWFRPASGEIPVDGDRAGGPWPKRVELEDKLRALIGSGRAAALDAPSRNTGAGARPVELDGAPLPDLGGPSLSARLRSVVLDDGQPRKGHLAWVHIDLIPRMRGSAVAVLHEPIVAPELQDEPPIASSLGEWLEHHDPAAWSALQAERDRMHIDMSIVLTRARIDSPAALEEQVNLRLAALTAAPKDERLMERIREAQRWLILAQREPSFRAQARDAWAHAVEELGAHLAGLGRPYLVRWRRNKKREVPLVGEAEERLRRVGLLRRLGPSEGYVLRWTEERDRNLDTSAVGAGASVTLWLLPILLLDLEAARRYAGHVQVAVQRHPDLFDDLAELIAIRNHAFHEGRGRTSSAPSSDLPEHAERRFMAVVGALGLGLASAPLE